MTNTLPSDPIDVRLLALADWVTLNTPTEWHPVELEPLGGDAGFRRYFRFSQSANGDTASATRWLAVDAPPESEDTLQFIAIAELIRNQGLASPAILAADPIQGFLLVEDLGDELLFRAITSTNADNLYRRAIDTLLQLQQIPKAPKLIPPYDRAQLRRELELFTEWFVGKLLNYSISDSERQLLEHTFAQLENTVLMQPQRFVHRDYHSRNLLLKADGTLGIIDFQGALWGGITYDLVSLLKDCYIRWPAGKVHEWATYYYEKASTANQLRPTNQLPPINQLSPVDKTEFLRWFDWTGLQRHIKVLGIFSRLLLRDDKPGYAQDLPLVIRYTLEAADHYAELRPFAEWFREALLPLLERQFWYSDYRVAGDV